MRGKVLTVEERDDILRGICENLSTRAIATRLGPTQSVIFREITRNGGRGDYRVHAAQQRYETPTTHGPTTVTPLDAPAAVIDSSKA